MRVTDFTTTFNKMNLWVIQRPLWKLQGYSFTTSEMADAVVSEGSLQMFLCLLHFNRGIFLAFRPYVRDYSSVCFVVWFVARLVITAVKFAASFTCITRIIIWLSVRMADRVAERSGVRIAAWFTVRIANRVTGTIADRVADWFGVRIANRVTDTIADWLAVRIADRIVIKIASRFTSLVHTRFSITIITKIV